jgi:hypothetical protein
MTQDRKRSVVRTIPEETLATSPFGTIVACMSGVTGKPNPGLDNVHQHDLAIGTRCPFRQQPADLGVLHEFFRPTHCATPLALIED